jgi:hypothetical protein
MPLQVVPATESDAPRIVELEHLAYKDDSLTPILFPGPFPGDASAKRADEMIQQLHLDPTSRWLKVVDTDSNEMIAFAKWNVYEPGKPRPQLPERIYGQGCNKAACKQFWGVMDDKRQYHMGKTPHVCMLRVPVTLRLFCRLTWQGSICYKPIRSIRDEEPAAC